MPQSTVRTAIDSSVPSSSKVRFFVESSIPMKMKQDSASLVASVNVDLMSLVIITHMSYLDDVISII